MSEFGYEPEKVGLVRGLQRSLSREKILGGADSNKRRGGGLTRSLSGDKLLDRRRSSRMPRREGLTRSMSGDGLSSYRSSSQRPGLSRSGGSKSSLRNLLGGLGSNSNHGGANKNATWGSNDGNNRRSSGLRRSGNKGSLRNLFQGMSKDDYDDSEHDSRRDYDDDDDDIDCDGDARATFAKSKKKNSFSNLSNPLSRSFSNLNNSRNASFSKNELDDFDGVDMNQLQKEMRGKKRLENREQTLLLLCKELGLMDE